MLDSLNFAHNQRGAEIQSCCEQDWETGRMSWGCRLMKETSWAAGSDCDRSPGEAEAAGARDPARGPWLCSAYACAVGTCSWGAPSCG